MENQMQEKRLVLVKVVKVTPPPLLDLHLLFAFLYYLPKQKENSANLTYIIRTTQRWRRFNRWLQIKTNNKT